MALGSLGVAVSACSDKRVVQTVLPPEPSTERWRSSESPDQSRQKTEAPPGEGFGLVAQAWSAAVAGSLDAGAPTTGVAAASGAAGSGAPGSLGVAGASTQAAPPQEQAVPGASGLGDGYFPDYGNSGYDVRHYDIQLRYTPSQDRLVGSTTITLVPNVRLSRFNVDFVLAVNEVTVDGIKAQFERADQHELVIVPSTPLLSDRAIDVVVKYDDVPSRVHVSGVHRSGWWRTSDGVIGAGAPENAWWWFPSNDHPLDKATYDVSVTVPEGVSAISNGVQLQPPMAAMQGWVTWSWRSSEPQQTYVALLAVGNFELVETRTKQGIPLSFAYPKGVDTQAARAALERTEDIVSWEASLFGPYPFEAMGGIVSPNDGIAYANETQTRPVYPISFFGGRGDGGTSMIAHANAHQWFGDSAAIKQWRDVWMSEGFATYAEWLFSEAQGTGTAQEIFDANYTRLAAGDPFWQLAIGDPGKDHLYDTAVYTRGAMTLHQLRVVLGDDQFFLLLRTWADTRRFGNGSTEDFRALAEAIAGRPFGDLFNAWLFTPAKPELPGMNDAQTFSANLPQSWAALLATQQYHRPLSPPPTAKDPAASSD